THQDPVSLKAWVTDLSRPTTSKAVVAGIAAAAITPIVLPLIKPTLKVTVKTGVGLYERAKIALAETGEFLADVAAEARAEVQAASPQAKTIPSSESTLSTATFSEPSS
ncbi:MAG: DUF5132 domain-containing protein, partial [Cyanobacteria bacterium P01_F01_bin.3]